jgi:hypothetical protein
MRVVGQFEFEGKEALIQVLHCLHAEQEQTKHKTNSCAAMGHEQTLDTLARGWYHEG